MEPLKQLDLSNKYITHDTIEYLRKLRCSGGIENLIMQNSVVVHDAENKMDLMGELQQALLELSGTLKRINFARSNVSGRIFYQGRESIVEKPAEEHVTIESTSSDGRPVIRDDNPQLEVKESNNIYKYLKTIYVKESQRFLRYYVMLDWLKNVIEIDMTGTCISGYGLISLAAATASKLQVLRIAHCPSLDNKGLYAIASMCTALRYLDISNCPLLTCHGVMYLAHLPPLQVQKLQHLDVSCNPAITTNVALALLHALEENGFRGKLIAGSGSASQGGSGSGGIQEMFGNPRIPSAIDEKFNEHRDRIIDLAFNDITKLVLTVRSIPHLPSPSYSTQSSHNFTLQYYEEQFLLKKLPYELDLTDRLINDHLLLLILQQWGDKLYALKLSGTLISEKGLSYLVLCPHLRVLHLARCWNIIYKQEANKAIMPSMKTMSNLKELNVSDTRLSGRMLSDNKEIRLYSLYASRCPFSVYAIRYLANTSKDTMIHLSLSGCNFMNKKAMHYLQQFTQLETLDLSHCSGLTFEDLLILRNLSPLALSKLHQLNIVGIRDVDANTSQLLANYLTTLSLSHQPITVIGSEAGKTCAIFRGETLTEQCNYAGYYPNKKDKSEEERTDERKMVIDTTRYAVTSSEIFEAAKGSLSASPQQTSSLNPSPPLGRSHSAMTISTSTPFTSSVSASSNTTIFTPTTTPITSTTIPKTLNTSVSSSTTNIHQGNTNVINSSSYLMMPRDTISYPSTQQQQNETMGTATTGMTAMMDEDNDVPLSSLYLQLARKDIVSSPSVPTSPPTTHLVVYPASSTTSTSVCTNAAPFHLSVTNTTVTSIQNSSHNNNNNNNPIISQTQISSSGNTRIFHTPSHTNNSHGSNITLPIHSNSSNLPNHTPNTCAFRSNGSTMNTTPSTPPTRSHSFTPVSSMISSPPPSHHQLSLNNRSNNFPDNYLRMNSDDINTSTDHDGHKPLHQMPPIIQTQTQQVHTTQLSHSSLISASPPQSPSLSSSPSPNSVFQAPLQRSNSHPTQHSQHSPHSSPHLNPFSSIPNAIVSSITLNPNPSVHHSQSSHSPSLPASRSSPSLSSLTLSSNPHNTSATSPPSSCSSPHSQTGSPSSTSSTSSITPDNSQPQTPLKRHSLTNSKYVRPGFHNSSSPSTTSTNTTTNTTTNATTNSPNITPQSINNYSRLANSDIQPSPTHHSTSKLSQLAITRVNTVPPFGATSTNLAATSALAPSMPNITRTQSHLVPSHHHTTNPNPTLHLPPSNMGGCHSPKSSPKSSPTPSPKSSPKLNTRQFVTTTTAIATQFSSVNMNIQVGGSYVSNGLNRIDFQSYQLSDTNNRTESQSHPTTQKHTHLI